mgnify:CR=1 FL=1
MRNSPNFSTSLPTEHILHDNDNPRASGSRGAPRRPPEAPRPLMRSAGEPTPFPVDALGSVLAPAARAISDLVNAPLATAGTSVLAAASLAVQPHVDVVLPHGQRRPTSSLFLSIGESGIRKSAVDGYANGPIQRHQEILAARCDDEMAEFRDACDAAKKSGEPTPPPRGELFLVDDPTPEGLYRTLAENQPTAGLFSDEGGRFLGGHGMAEDTRLRTATTLSLLWDGAPISRVRGGERGSRLSGRRLSAHLMVQPGVAATLLTDDVMRDQGLLARVNVTAPACLMGERFYRDPDPAALAVVDDYDRWLSAMMAEPLSMNHRGDLKTRALTIAPAAKSDWVLFHDKIEHCLAPDGILRPISGYAAKLPEHAARFAAVLAAVEDLDTGAVEKRHMEGGIALARHFAREALRLFSVPSVDHDLVEAEILAKWLLDHYSGRLVALVDIYQRGPRFVRNARKAGRLMSILEHHFWVSHVPGVHEVNGVRRTQVWLVEPHHVR